MFLDRKCLPFLMVKWLPVWSIPKLPRSLKFYSNDFLCEILLSNEKFLMFEISICFSLFWFIRKMKQITYLRPSWIAWCFHFCNWQREHKNKDRHEHASFLQWGMHLTGGGMTVALSHIVLLRDLLRSQLNDTSSFANIPSPSTPWVSKRHLPWTHWQVPYTRCLGHHLIIQLETKCAKHVLTTWALKEYFRMD